MKGVGFFLVMNALSKQNREVFWLMHKIHGQNIRMFGAGLTELNEYLYILIGYKVEYNMGE